MPTSSAISYRHVNRINDWNQKHVAQFLNDHDLTDAIDILEGIDGEGLIESYRIYQKSPDTLYKMFNSRLETSFLGLFFKFIAALRKYAAIIDVSVYY